MSEPLVRIVSVKCQECGEEGMAFSASNRRGGVFPMIVSPEYARLLMETMRHVVNCGGRVLIATEPAQQEVGE